MGSLTNHTVSKIRGHSIAFRHTAPVVCSLAMLLNQIQTGDSEKSDVAGLLQEALSVHLLGSKGKEDNIAYTANKVLKARPFVVYTWLSILQKTHTLYRDDPPLPDFTEFETVIEDCNSIWFANAEHIRNKQVLNAKKTIGDDISGVRASVMEEGDVAASTASKSTSSSKDEEEQDNDPALSFSYVVDQEQYVNNLTSKVRDRDNAEIAAESLEELAQVFNIDLKDKLKQWREKQHVLWESE